MLGLPGGQLLVGAVGIGIMVAGGAKIYEGWQKKFVDDMDMPSDRHARMVAERTGQVGFIAKGMAIALIGLLVVIAAWQFDPRRRRAGRRAQDAGQPAVRAVPADRWWRWGWPATACSASSTPATTGCSAAGSTA